MGGGGSGADTGGSGWVSEGQAFAEARGVLLGDGEDAVATLRAAGAAGKMGAGAGGGGGQGGVDDLEEGVDLRSPGVRVRPAGRGRG